MRPRLSSIIAQSKKIKNSLQAAEKSAAYFLWGVACVRNERNQEKKETTCAHFEHKLEDRLPAERERGIVLSCTEKGSKVYPAEG